MASLLYLVQVSGFSWEEKDNCMKQNYTSDLPIAELLNVFLKCNKYLLCHFWRSNAFCIASLSSITIDICVV